MNMYFDRETVECVEEVYNHEIKEYRELLEKKKVEFLRGNQKESGRLFEKSNNLYYKIKGMEKMLDMFGFFFLKDEDGNFKLGR